MKNRRTKVSLGTRGLLPALLGLCLSSCSEENSDPKKSETLAEYVARCESFTGDTLADCPEDCAVVDAVRISYDGMTCEMETDAEGIPIREDLCLAADESKEHPYGHRGVYRRVEVGDAADDPVTPSEPETVLRLKIYGDLRGWERCTEVTSDYCACALQFEDLDG